MRILKHFIKNDKKSKNDIVTPEVCRKCYKPTYTLYPGKLCGDCYEDKVKGGTK